MTKQSLLIAWKSDVNVNCVCVIVIVHHMRDQIDQLLVHQKVELAEGK